MNKTFSLLFLLLTYSLAAQETTLTANLTYNQDSISTGQWTIHSLPDSTLRKGGYIDSDTIKTSWRTKGQENFYIKISAFGFKDTLISFVVSDNLVDLGTINLTTDASLSEVKVTFTQPLFERSMDGLKVNVQGTTLETLNNLFDVLKASPKLTSPDDERIEIIGKGSPLILIDRQPIMSNEELKAVPANMIDRIEIITNPSAKYRAQGRGSGVIEVYTKNFHLEGYNMNVSASGGINTQGKPTAQLSTGINLKHKKFSLNGYIGMNYNSNYTFSDAYGYTTTGLPREQYADADGSSWNIWDNYNIKGAFQFNPKHKLTFGLSGHGSFYGSTSRNHRMYYEDSIHTSTSIEESQGDGQWLTNAAFTNYVWETDTNHSALEINFNYTLKTDISDDETQSLFRDELGETFGSFAVRNQFNDIPNAFDTRINYDHIFDTSGWELSVGLAFNYLFNNKEYDQFNRNGDDWVVDPLYSNTYNYKEGIGALYAEVSKKWNKVGFQLGVRGEFTRLYGNSQSLNQVFIDSSYILPFPTASFMYEPGDNVAMTVSYSSGIDRPQFDNYDPFVRIEDSLTISYGNPYLLPAIEQTIDFTIDLFYAYSLSVGYSFTKDPISELSFVSDSSFLIENTPWNARKEQELFASLNLPIQLKWLRGWNSVWVNYSRYDYEPIFEREPFFNVSYGFYSGLTFLLPMDFSIHNSLHLSRWGSDTYVSNAQVYWSMRLTKKFLDGDISVFINVANIVPPKYKSTFYSSNYNYESSGQYQFTTFKVGAFIKFGRLKRADNIQGGKSSQSDRL